MALPWLIAGAIGAIIADEVLSDSKPELKTSTDRKQISASDVPEDIRRQIEGEHLKKAKNWYRYANEYFYGLNGESVDMQRAKMFFKMAADAGHFEAQRKLRELF